MLRNSISFFKNQFQPIILKRTRFAPPLDTRKPAVKMKVPDSSGYQCDPDTDLMYKHTVKEPKIQKNNSTKPTP